MISARRGTLKCLAIYITRLALRRFIPSTQEKDSAGEQIVSWTSARQRPAHSLSGNINLPIRYEWIERRTTFLTKQTYPRFFYVYYDRQYHEPYGAGHDGNPPHRVAPVWRKKTA